ncbi:hypothetical protein Tco_1207262, partial [Tanacetum coccineum]
RTRALEQETRDLDEEIRQIKDLKARNGYHTKDKKKAKNKQNRARNGKGQVKSKPKSVKKSTGKSTPKKSKAK